MAKKSNNSAPEMENGNVKLPEDLRPVQKEISILEAKLKDGSCLFTFKCLTGVDKGRPFLSKDNKYLVKDTLENAFQKFNVHMAVILGVYGIAGKEVDDIDKFHNDDLTYLFTCTGFKITGDEDNEAITLIGTMRVTMNGWVSVELPKTALDSLSSYKWYNELKAAADDARHEVEMFKNGNYTIPDDMKEDEEAEEQATGKSRKKKVTQMKIAPADGEEVLVPTEDDIFDEGFDDEFGEAKL